MSIPNARGTLSVATTTARSSATTTTRRTTAVNNQTNQQPNQQQQTTLQSPWNPLQASAAPVVTTRVGGAVHRRTPVTRVRETVTVLLKVASMTVMLGVRGTLSVEATTARSSATTTTRRTTAANNRTESRSPDGLHGRSSAPAA